MSFFDATILLAVKVEFSNFQSNLKCIQCFERNEAIQFQKDDNSVSSTTENIIKPFTQRAFILAFHHHCLLLRTIISKALYIPPFASLEQIQNCCQHLLMLAH